jgi:hypothetical protein
VAPAACARGRLGMGASGVRGLCRPGGDLVDCAVTPLRPARRNAVGPAAVSGPIMWGGDAA